MSVLARLRAETRELHDAVEARVPLLAPEATTADYGWFLGKMWAFHRSVDEALGPCRSDDDALLAPRADAAAADYATITASLSMPPLATFACAALTLPSPAHALGCAYVVAGSSLGARVLHRALLQRFPNELAQAARFLTAGGLGARNAWLALCERLEGAPHSEPVVQGARRTFAHLLSHLDTPPLRSLQTFRAAV